MVKIEIDSGSGFCFGVVNAIKKAEEELNKSGILYCLGDIVHNNHEVDRLKAKGLITIDHEKLKELHDVKVLLRAHGEPPETYRIARENRIEIIDATCPVVLQLQKKIKESYKDTDKTNSQIVIYGKPGHAEVNGLVGQTDGKATIIEGIEDLTKINFDQEIRLYSQTTKSVEGFKHIVSEINRKKKEGTSFLFYDTICRQVANRIPNIRDFARKHELILFVSGKKSSNGRVLFEECLSVNPQSKLVSNKDEIEESWLEGKRSIGICGATSTPKWLMEDVYEFLKSKLQD
ncbi:4-hydroxy-3-methylbut-2-enyl diphosphate reductase [Coprobacter tertius]|uniref:4-hydroxy-3-methylbut-2-enyl diphosphate reductase n=1 Tax=Coprobacter tertius TaxID=2944915 RepID=A0ABT1MG28_9BACT|nr:4-hydroxy-3-methylbut-2-enyl diphosphate reductase [Coprobacter tertius]MCP9611595.1 4-hydroxy-3-methylbut-2-enyl diphosphate reductase [Coprobacter tertius]